MGFSKSLIVLAAVSSVVATPAFAGVESLSVASQTAATTANAGAAKDVRATTKSRKASNVGGAGLGVGIAAAVAGGLGVAAAAGAFDNSDSK